MASEPPEFPPEGPADADATSDGALRRLAEQAAGLERIMRESAASLSGFQAASIVWLSEWLSNVGTGLGTDDKTDRSDLITTLRILLGSANTHAMVTAAMRAMRLRDRDAPADMQNAAQAELARRNHASAVLLLGRAASVPPTQAPEVPR